MRHDCSVLRRLSATIVIAAALTTPAAPARGDGGVASALDTIPRTDYLRRHALSLDNFLENEPGGLLVRLGPIGFDARYSRWAIGRGRARLALGDILLNNPQNDAAPLVHTATSLLERLVVDDEAAPWIEGALRLEERTPPTSRPRTFVELSNGDEDLRQRRVGFSSEAGAVGLDLSYDEVLNDGYPFDASGTVVHEPNFGKARSRTSGLVLRGEIDAARYAFGARQFRSSTTGDLVDASNNGSYDGHLMWMDAGVGAVGITAYGRGFSSSEPDSESVNETVGGIVRWDASPAGGPRTAIVAGVERIHSTVRVGSDADVSLTRATLTARAAWSVGERTTLHAGVAGAGDREISLAWGATAAVRRELGSNAISVTARRSFRMPNLGERYLPAHARDGLTLAGDERVEAESAWELGADWEVTARGVVNRIRAAWVQSEDAIAFRPRVVGSETWRVAANAAESPAMSFFEERLQTVFSIGVLRARAFASAVFTSGEREEAFASVPEFMATASLLVGGELFEETSAIYGGAEFVHCDPRSDFDGRGLPAFDVLNFIIEGRLLDARVYVKYTNALDEAYRTQGDYLMTPATLMYGIEWTLFD